MDTVPEKHTPVRVHLSVGSLWLLVSCQVSSLNNKER